MSRRIFSLILALALCVLSVGSALAIGNSTRQNNTAPTVRPLTTPKPTAKPTRKPTAAPRTFEITSVRSNGDGSVNVKWKDSANGAPYTISYKKYVNYQIDSDEHSDLVTWRILTGLNGTSATLDDLIPGKWYWIILRDKNNDRAYYAWRPERSDYPDFSEFKLRSELSLRTKVGSGKAKGVQTFSVSDIQANLGSKDYGAYIKLNYPQLRKARTYMATVGVTLPNGDYYTDWYSSMDLPAGNHYSYFQFYDFTSMFRNLNDVGSLMAGEYTWSLYFDDYFVCSSTFRLTR